MKKIALVQMTSTQDQQKNLEKIFLSIEKAAAENADLVAFPENCLHLADKQHMLENTMSISGPLINEFQEKARQFDISVLLGSIHEKIPDNPQKAYNTSLLIDKQGEILATYRKIHLFDVDLKDVKLYESENIQAGNQLVTCDHEIGTVGLTICYDIRFPNLYQKLTRAGARIIFVPSAFTVPTGKAHWLTLLRTRAIENQVYLAAPAQYGKHSSTRESFGSTVLFDPWGDVIDILPEGEGIVFGEIDPDLQDQVRRRMPVSSHQVQGIDF